MHKSTDEDDKGGYVSVSDEVEVKDTSHRAYEDEEKGSTKDPDKKRGEH